MCIHVSVHVSDYSIHRSQKKASNPLELEPQAALSLLLSSRSLSSLSQLLSLLFSGAQSISEAHE